MNKEIKYYTPDIEAFHVGFEYEFLNNSDFKKGLNTWRPSTFVNGQHITEYALENLYRVKYLDKEDIEEVFGKNIIKYESFYGKQYTTDNYYELEIKTGPVDETRTRFRLRIKGDNKLTIEKAGWDLIFDGNFIFQGYIKNKSELKILLKQLNIKK